MSKNVLFVQTKGNAGIRNQLYGRVSSTILIYTKTRERLYHFRCGTIQRKSFFSRCTCVRVPVSAPKLAKFLHETAQIANPNRLTMRP